MFYLSKSMSPEKIVDRALILIGKARIGKINCEKALDELWEILVNLDFELKTRNPIKRCALYN